MNEDVTFSEEKTPDGLLPKYVRISERVTKTRTGRKQDVRDQESKAYADIENPDICPVRTFKKYKEMKTESQNADGVQFLRTVKQSAQNNPKKHIHWYSSQNMGEHRIGKWSHCCNVFKNLKYWHLS